MIDVSSEVTETCQTAPASLIDVLHQAPRLYELLPCSSRQLLSATCSHLHKWIREDVSCITIRHASELSHFAPKDWPNLSGILMHEKADPFGYLDSRRLSTRRWHLDAQICFDKRNPGDAIVMLLISLCDSHPQAKFDLTPQQCKVLSQCADRLRQVTYFITLVPQQQGQPEYHETSTACSALSCLPNQLWSCLGCQPWPELIEVNIRGQRCSLVCTQGLVRCSLPALGYLSCSGVSTAGLHELVHACWPHLCFLDLSNSKFVPSAVTLLSTSSWCGQLESLKLQGTVLGEEGVRALGVGQWGNLLQCDLGLCKIGSCDAMRCLAQVHFPSLCRLWLTGNEFEAGAIACLSAAQWPDLSHVSLGCQDVDDQDWQALGICKKTFSEPAANGQHHILLDSPSDNAILPSITFQITLA